MKVETLEDELFCELAAIYEYDAELDYDEAYARASFDVLTDNFSWCENGSK